MNKKKRTVLISVIAAVLVLGGVFAALKLTVGKLKPVNVYSMNDVSTNGYGEDTLSTDGFVRTEGMQNVFISGTQSVTEVFVKEGQTVKVGDKLAAFDTTLSDIELERQRIAVEKMEYDLTTAKSELVKINGYTPYVPEVPSPEPEPVVLDPVPLPYADGGSGTEESPYVYLWNDNCWYTSEFIDKLIPLVPAENESEESEASPDGIELPKADYQPQHVYVVFENREYDNPDGELLNYQGMELFRLGNGTFKFKAYTPDANYRGEAIEPDIDPEPIYEPDGPMYTASEIAQMRAQKEKEIKDLELQIKVENVKYQKLQLEVSTGIVTAEMDGVVKTVADADEAQMNGTAFIVVSGGKGGYYIEGTFGEFQLETVEIGQPVKVISWMNYQEIEAGIVEIGEYPVTNGWFGGQGNDNTSYYPFTVFISGDYSFQDGEYVSIEYSPAKESTGIYLQIPFVLNENSRSYVFVMDENGLLQKREVQVGKMLWSSYVEIKSGLTADDYVAFPYGSDVKEGAEAVVAGIDQLYDYY